MTLKVNSSSAAKTARHNQCLGLDKASKVKTSESVHNRLYAEVCNVATASA
jgi:hypothetical protein